MLLGSFEGIETECERSIQLIEQKIIGDPVMKTFMNERYQEIQEVDNVRITEHVNTLEVIDANAKLPSISTWLNDIKSNVESSLENQGNGNADNIYFNQKFAKHFLRLCKLFPLWSIISCQLFGTPATVSSSANVESYFKDVKHVHADIIPCVADKFAENHMITLSQEIIKASQTSRFVGPNVPPTSKAKKIRSKTVANAKENCLSIENEPDSTLSEVSNETCPATGCGESKSVDTGQ